MNTIKKNGFLIASSGMATQVVLVCHGGWIKSDGITKIPQGLRLCFYAGHGHLTLGTSVYEAVRNNPSKARGGLLKQLGMSEGDLALLAQSKNKSVEEMRAEQLKYTTGMYDSFGGGYPMFNYALSREPKGGRLDGEKRLFKAHTKGAASVDVDLMMMDTSKTRHLSDVFDIIDGMDYQTLHYGACRVSYGDSPSEVAAQ